MATKARETSSGWADREAPNLDPTWHAEYHDAWEGVVHLDADAAGHVAIASEAAERAAVSMGLHVVGATTAQEG
jgi:hypothetical protein